MVIGREKCPTAMVIVTLLLAARAQMGRLILLLRKKAVITIRALPMI